VFRRGPETRVGRTNLLSSPSHQLAIPLSTIEAACEYMIGLPEEEAMLTQWQHAARPACGT